jgi:hypothetical protein
MRSAVHWFGFGFSVLFGVVMVFLGVFFVRSTCISLYVPGNRAIFCPLLLAALLMITGGGLLSAAVLRSMKRWAR